MATNAVVVTNTLATVNTEYTDFTSMGFGTVQAALIFISDANTTDNPSAHAGFSVGLWTPTAERVSSVASDDAAATSNTWRRFHSDSTGQILDGSGTVLTDITASATTNGIRLTKDAGSSSLARYATVVLFNGLTNAYAGAVNLGTGTTAINVIDPGFRANSVFAITAGSADSTSGNHGVLSFGAAAIDALGAVQQGLISFASEDTQAVAQDVDTMVRNDAVACQNFNGTLTWRASIGAHASGFTITPNANAGSDVVAYLALELADPDDAYVGVVDTITGTGNQAYTGAGFTPLALILGQTMCTAVNTNTTIGYFGIGAGGPATVEQSLGIVDVDAGVNSDTESYADTSNIVNIRDGIGSTDTVAALSSFDSDGWTLNYSDGSGTARKLLAIAIGDSTAGGATNLIIDDTTHSHSTDVLDLTSQHLLTVDDAIHNHRADVLDLTASSILFVGDATHSHSADNLTLSTVGSTNPALSLPMAINITTVSATPRVTLTFV